MKLKAQHILRLGLLCFVLSNLTGRAQWLTQSFDLKAGWTAIYTHVDASSKTLDQLIASDANNPIQEVWLWKPPITTAQFVNDPQQPTNTGTQWGYWKRGEAGNTLERLIPNQAFLVRVDNGTATYTWSVQGVPEAYQFRWTTTGLNFVGFPTVPTGALSFEDFLNKSPELQQNAEIYQYIGGDLGPVNPSPLFAFRTTPVLRGEAVWMRAADLFNRYFGPFEVDLQNGSGFRFEDSQSQFRFRLKNLMDEAVTITGAVVSSEAAPAGETAIVGDPPLLLRGELDGPTLTYGYTHFNAAPQTWVLQPKGQVGCEVEVIIGIDRSVMAGNPGDLFAGIVRFTDSLGFSQLDVPVSATIASTEGLWVGEAIVDQVQHQLATFQKDADGSLVLDSEGQVIQTSSDQSLGEVKRPASLRLILHNNNASEVVLMQQVYHGFDTNDALILTNQEEALDSGQLESARRITAVHLPWTQSNVPWNFLGNLNQGETLTTVVTTGHDDHASNPFLHTYHPDHDNLNATFTQNLPQGFESYGITRTITLTVDAPPDDFSSRTSGNLNLSGTYAETIELGGTAGESKQYQVQGGFALKRLSAINSLTLQ